MNDSVWLAERFHQAIEHTMQHTEQLPERLLAAGSLLANCIVGDGRIWTLGNGPSGLLAQHFSTLMLSCFRHNRPALPSVCLSQDGASLTAIYDESGASDIYGNQLQALGQPGDCLLLIYHGDAGNACQRALKAAHARQMRVIALGGNDPDIRALLHSEDAEISIEASNQARLTELQLLSVHCLCEFIDYRVFGYDG